MRVRFKRSLIIKLGIITLVLVFTIPYFVSKLDNTNRQESLKFRSWNKVGIRTTVELQWLEHSWFVYHGSFELVLESLEKKNPIAADWG